jgi:hypothetical protein
MIGYRREATGSMRVRNELRGCGEAGMESSICECGGLTARIWTADRVGSWSFLFAGWVGGCCFGLAGSRSDGQVAHES